MDASAIVGKESQDLALLEAAIKFAYQLEATEDSRDSIVRVVLGYIDARRSEHNLVRLNYEVSTAYLESAIKQEDPSYLSKMH